MKSMTTNEYAHCLRLMRNKNNPLAVRIQAAKDAADYEDAVQKLAYESHIQYLFPEQEEARIAHYARIAHVAQKWLRDPRQPVPPLKQIITIEGGLPPLPGTNVLMPILP